jgi:ElaB/YqjD/DUF883 family membrane-anchored ribosome-binding protein
MAGERDQAGTPGAGLTGAGRDVEGMRAGTSGSSAMGDRGLGSAEVHSGLHSGGKDAYSGLQFAETPAAGGMAGRARDAAGEADDLRGRARHVAEDLGHRASDAASAARERMSGLRERANNVLERRGVVDRLRENPLPMLGVAFAVGFLLAGSDDRTSNTRASRARRELKSALVAGLSAGIAQGARSFLSEAGTEGSSFVNSLVDNLVGEQGRGGDSRRESYAEGRGGYGGSTGGRPGRAASRPPSHQESF